MLKAANINLIKLKKPREVPEILSLKFTINPETEGIIKPFPIAAIEMKKYKIIILKSFI